MTAPPTNQSRPSAITLTYLTTRPNSRIRLYCVPPSGAGPQFYQPWVPLLSELVDLAVADLPGRGARTGEPSITNLRSAATDLADLIEADLRRDPVLDGGYALFGHSFGGLLAFETARCLRRAQATQPNLLAISASPAPQLNELRNHVVTNLHGGIGALANAMGWDADPNSALEPSVVAAIYTPFLADAVALLQHTHHDETPLDARISVFGGHDDPIAPPETLRGWASHSSTGVQTHLHPGNHHYLRETLPAVITELTADLLRACRRPAPHS